jgi:hypothetical protein
MLAMLGKQRKDAFGCAQALVRLWYRRQSGMCEGLQVPLEVPLYR